MRFTPRGFGGDRADAEAAKRDAWRKLGTLAISIFDIRLSWPEKEFVERLGDRLYGKRKTNEGRHE